MDTYAALHEARLQRVEAELKETKRAPKQKNSQRNAGGSQQQQAA